MKLWYRLNVRTQIISQPTADRTTNSTDHVTKYMKMLGVLFISCIAVISAQNFKIVHEWKSIDYDFLNDTMKREYLSSGKYVLENNMPLGLHIWKNKMFITVPRWRNGVAANLNYISMKDMSQSPILRPYPDWKANDIDSPDGIVSIFRVRSDSCNRLWGVDTGVDDVLGEDIAIKSARLIVIDLNTDKIIRTHIFPDSVKTANSFFVDLAVDVNSNNCEDAHAYISDIGYGLVTYSWAKNVAWRFTHKYFGYDPLNNNFSVNGINFEWRDGIFGLALTPPQSDGYRILYFHAMSGITEFSVSTEILKNKSASEPTKFDDFHVVGVKGPRTQGASSIIDQNSGIDYFTQVNKNGMACWNTNRELKQSTFILFAQNNVTMVFPQDLSIDVQTRMLYVMSNNLQKLLYSKFNLHDVNFYITAAQLESLEPICQSSLISTSA